MANNYMEFSEAIDKLTEDEIRWWEDEARRVADIHENMDAWPDDYDPDEDVSLCSDFSVDKADKLVWFNSDSNGDVDKIAHIVQKFLHKFRPEDYFSLTWACWCSKPRLGEFSGGAMFVTSIEAKFFGVTEWILGEIKRHS